MPSLLDVLALLRSNANERPDIGGGVQRPYTMAGRVLDANQPAPSSIFDVLAQRPSESPDAEGMGGLASLAMGAKVFKPQPSTMEDLIKSLSTAKEGVGGRGRLYPVLKDMATGEEYIGPRGGNHPWEQYQATMAARKGLAQAKTIAPGYKVAETAPFMPPELAQHLAFPEGVSQVNRLLDKGLSMQSIVEALRMGKQVEK